MSNSFLERTWDFNICGYELCWPFVYWLYISVYRCFLFISIYRSMCKDTLIFLFFPQKENLWTFALRWSIFSTGLLIDCFLWTFLFLQLWKLHAIFNVAVTNRKSWISPKCKLNSCYSIISPCRYREEIGIKDYKLVSTTSIPTFCILNEWIYIIDCSLINKQCVQFSLTFIRFYDYIFEKKRN